MRSKSTWPRCNAWETIPTQKCRRTWRSCSANSLPIRWPSTWKSSMRRTSNCTCTSPSINRPRIKVACKATGIRCSVGLPPIDHWLIAHTSFERLEAVQADTIVPRVLSAQMWLSTSEQDMANTSVDKLIRWIEAHPLPKERIQNDATNQRRVTTSPQATIWLVAECLKRPFLTAKGIQLARRAAEASRLQNDPSFTIAILSEWIEIADRER